MNLKTKAAKLSILILLFLPLPYLYGSILGGGITMMPGIIELVFLVMYLATPTFFIIPLLYLVYYIPIYFAIFYLLKKDIIKTKFIFSLIGILLVIDLAIWGSIFTVFF